MSYLYLTAALEKRADELYESGEYECYSDAMNEAISESEEAMRSVYKPWELY